MRRGDLPFARRRREDGEITTPEPRTAAIRFPEGRNTGDPIIQTEKLTHIYGAGTPFEHTALFEVDFSAAPGELLGLIGHTGSGKTTLVQHLNGLLKPTSGRVRFKGGDIWEDKSRLRGIRFRVGLVFQYPEYQLFEETVYGDIAYGPKNMGLDGAEIDRRVRRAADFVELKPETLQKSPFELSGGQKRRVAIAGVIAMEPEVLVLDEPTAGLDPAGRESILRNILNYHRETGATVIHVSHSMDLVARIADRIVVMNDSRLAMEGTPRAVFSRADELRSMRRAVPEITRSMQKLREMGLDIDPAVYTLEEARQVLRRLKEGAGNA
jgi:energy-coupling factor transport system ATP-binding protein